MRGLNPREPRAQPTEPRREPVGEGRQSARGTGKAHSQLNASFERPSDHAVAGSFAAAAGVGTDSAASTSGASSAPADLMAATSATATGGELPSEGVHAPWPVVGSGGNEMNDMSVSEVVREEMGDMGHDPPSLMTTARDELGSIVPLTIKDKIWRGEYLELGCLLKNAPVQGDDTAFVLTGSGSTMRLQPRRRFFFPNRFAPYLSEATWIENKYQSLT